ncbi:MAG: DUF1697 domain-containing protein [Vicinamibacterales bacterium]
MPRYVAFLRGVMPTNASMADLRRAFEQAGFDEVRTVLGSGNVTFTTASTPEAKLARACEAAMTDALGRTFPTVIRSTRALETMLAADPFSAFEIPAGAKRVVTFLRTPPKPVPTLPIEADGVRILHLDGCEAFTTYVSGPAGPIFMKMIEKTFGKDVTTRTWDTIRKCVKA